MSHILIPAATMTEHFEVCKVHSHLFTSAGVLNQSAKLTLREMKLILPTMYKLIGYVF